MDSLVIHRFDRGENVKQIGRHTFSRSDSCKTSLTRQHSFLTTATTQKQRRNSVLKTRNWSHHRHTSTFRHHIPLKLCKLLNEFNAASTTALIIITISRLLFQSELQKTASEGRKERRLASKDNRNIYIPLYQQKKQQSLCKTYHNVGNSIIPLQESALRKCRQNSIPTFIFSLARLQNFFPSFLSQNKKSPIEGSAKFSFWNKRRKRNVLLVSLR